MTIGLPKPSQTYDFANEAVAREALSKADAQNMKLNAVFNSIKFRDTADGTIKTVTIASGAFVIT